MQTGSDIYNVELEDIDEQAGMLPEWEQEYRQIGCGRFKGSIAIASVQDFELIRETTNQALHESFVLPKDQINVGIFRSDIGGTLNGRAWRQDSLMIVEGGRPYDVRTNGEAELLCLSMPRAVFYSQIHEQDVDRMDSAVAHTVIQLEAPVAAVFRGYFSRLSDLLQLPPEQLPSSGKRRLMASTIASDIALNISSMELADAANGMPRTKMRRSRIVQNAIDYMRQNAGEEIGILDVCRQTHVSRRTLQYCFEDVLNISPLQYLKAIRLNEARRRIKRLMKQDVVHEYQNTIADVAALCGFNHPSHFTSEYKKMFGVLPSETHRKAA